jgi:hypothetical protein
MVSEIGVICLIRERGKRLSACALFSLVLMSTLAIGTVKADPSIPKITPSGGNPVNIIWRGNCYAALVTAQMWNFGWEIKPSSENGAFATLARFDGGPLACWCMWIYEGGFSEDYRWRYWSYASVAHFYFDLNPFHWGWYLDDWEGAQDTIHLQWRDWSTLGKI